MPLSPRSATYERLETGLGSPRTGGKKMKAFAWKKFAIAAVTLITLVYLFGPRESTSVPWSSTGGAGDYPVEGEVIPRPPTKPIPPTQPNPPHPPTQPNPIPNHSTDIPPPTSFETDASPAGTVFCTAPYKPSLPIVQYAMMIDAGSTGSRIHVYKFNNCKSSPSYEYETFRQTRPGLSFYDGQPEKAAESLDVLMKEAMRVVPGDLRKCTPVAVKATAGLRLLGVEKSETILRAVRRRLENEYPFKVVDGAHGVEIMDGKDEGVYAWITANYLLETIHAGPEPSPVSATNAVLDLGGASTQIVFEPRWEDEKTQMMDGDHKYDLKFGVKKHVLYQHSYLGYGLMSARKSVHQLVDFMTSMRTSDSSSLSDAMEVGNPCLARGTQRTVEIEDERTGTKRNITMTGSDIGSFSACTRIVQLVMAKDSICEVKPCSFNGVYQPSLLDTFSTGKVLLLSYFYDRISPLYPSPSTRPKLTVSTFSTMATIICQGHKAWSTHWSSYPDLMQELEGRPEWCLDLTFMYGLLRLGYEFDDDREVLVEKEIGGTELGWALGATISMVSGGELTCRA